MTTDTKNAPTIKNIAKSELICPMCGSRKELALQNKGTGRIICDECGGEFDVILRPKLIER